MQSMSKGYVGICVAWWLRSPGGTTRLRFEVFRGCSSREWSPKGEIPRNREMSIAAVPPIGTAT